MIAPEAAFRRGRQVLYQFGIKVRAGHAGVHPWLISSPREPSVPGPCPGVNRQGYRLRRHQTRWAHGLGVPVTDLHARRGAAIQSTYWFETNPQCGLVAPLPQSDKTSAYIERLALMHHVPGRTGQLVRERLHRHDGQRLSAFRSTSMRSANACCGALSASVWNQRVLSPRKSVAARLAPTRAGVSSCASCMALHSFDKACVWVCDKKFDTTHQPLTASALVAMSNSVDREFVETSIASSRAGSLIRQSTRKFVTTLTSERSSAGKAPVTGLV